MVFLAVAFMACKKAEQDPHAGHGHGAPAETEDALDHGEEANASYTIYSENYELYVEFHPLVASQLTVFNVHVSRLNNFKPVKKGKLTINLIKGDKGIRNTVNLGDEKGIFHANLKPLQTGNYKLLFEYEADGITEKFSVNNVIVFKDEAGALESNSENNNYINFPKEQAWETDFASEIVKTGKFYEVIKTSGQVMPAQGDEKAVVAKTNGIVIFSNRDILPGMQVNKGSGLFVVSGRGLTDNNISAKYSELKTNLNNAKSVYDRNLKLSEDKIISEKDLKSSKANYDNALANYNEVASNFTRGGKSVSSPINGFIKNVYVKEGEYVEMGQALASVAMNKRLIIKAELSQSYLSSLKSITSANFITPYDKKEYDIDSLNAKLLSYGKNTDNSSFYTPVYFEIDNLGEIIPGSFIEVFLKAETENNAITVPLSSLLEEQGSFYVFIQHSGEDFEKREVICGQDDGINIRILKGVNKNERVVTKGAYKLKLISLSKNLPSQGHVH